jgi:hypothetical protein
MADRPHLGRPVSQPVLPSPAAAAPGPTVELALARFFAEHGLDRGGYRADRLVVRLGPLRLPFPNPGYLPFHDIHHVAVSAPPRFWGEVEVSVLELRSGCPTWLIWLLCVGAIALGAVVAPRRVLRTWRRYEGCRNVYRGHDLAELLALDLRELRRRMALPEPDSAADLHEDTA